MPGLTTVYKWARDNKEFAADLQDARKTAAATWLDRCLELLEQKDIPPNQLGFLREQMHHYRWLASKLISVYGDKSEVKQTGESTIKLCGSLMTPVLHSKRTLSHTGMEFRNN